MRYVVTPIPCPAAFISDSLTLPQWMQQAADTINLTADTLDVIVASRGIIKQHNSIGPSEALDSFHTYAEQLRMFLNTELSASEEEESSMWVVNAPSGSIQLTVSSATAELIMVLYASAALATDVACSDHVLAPQLLQKAQIYLKEAVQYCETLDSLGLPLPSAVANDGEALSITSGVLDALLSFINAQELEMAFTKFISRNTAWSLADPSLQENLRILLNSSKLYGLAAPVLMDSSFDCFLEIAELSAIKPHILTVAGRMAAARCLFTDGKYAKCIQECQETFTIIASSIPEEKEFVSISLCIECKDSLMEQLLELMAMAEAQQGSIESSSELINPPMRYEDEPQEAPAPSHSSVPEPVTIDLPPVKEPAAEFLTDVKENTPTISLLSNIICQKDADLARSQMIIDDLMCRLNEMENAAKTCAVPAIDYSAILAEKDSEIQRLQGLLLHVDMSELATAVAQSPQEVQSLQAQLNELHKNLESTTTQLYEQKLIAEYSKGSMRDLQKELLDIQELKETNRILVDQARCFNEKQAHSNDVVARDNSVQDGLKELNEELQRHIISLESQLLTAQKALADANETVALYHQDIIEAEAEAEKLQDFLVESQLAKKLEPVSSDVPLTDDLILGFARTALEIGGLKATAAQEKIYDNLIELVVALELANEKLTQRSIELETRETLAASRGGQLDFVDDDVEPGCNASLLRSIGTEIAIQSAWPRLPSLSTYLQNLVDRTLEQITDVVSKYVQETESQIDDSNNDHEYGYSRSDHEDSLEDSDDPQNEHWREIHSKLFGEGSASDNVNILEHVLQCDMYDASSLPEILKKLRSLGHGLQSLPTVMISSYDEERAYNIISSYILELVAEQHETNLEVTKDGYKDVELAHINIVDLRLHMQKTDKVMALYNRFSLDDQKRLYELQLLAQRKNSEIVTLLRYMNLLLQAYQRSIDAITQSIEDRALTGKINGVEISTVLLEKDEQITELQEALKVNREHAEQRVADMARDAAIVQNRCDILEKQLAEFRTAAGGDNYVMSIEDDGGIYGLLADRDRQIKELNDIVSMLRSGSKSHTLEQSTQHHPEYMQEHVQEYVQEHTRVSDGPDSNLTTDPVPFYYAVPSHDYSQLLVAKDTEIARLRELCVVSLSCPKREQPLVPDAREMANTYDTIHMTRDTPSESVYAQSGANFDEIQRLNTELNSSNSKVQELTESIELLKSKNDAASTALNNQNVQIDELTQEKQKLQNLVIQLTEENLVKSATVQSVMTTSVASSALATEINNLKTELNERDHEIVRLTHTIEGLNRQIVDNAGAEIPQISTVINISPDASDNEIIKNLVNSIKTQESSFTHIRNLLKEKQTENLKLKDALERQEDIVRTLLSNPVSGKISASVSADGNNTLVLTNYNDASGTDSQAAEEVRSRLEERIKKLEEDASMKDYVISCKDSEIEELQERLKTLEEEASELRSRVRDLEEMLADARANQGNGEDPGDGARMMDDYTKEMLESQIKNLYETIAAKDMEINGYKRTLGIEDGGVFTYL